MLVIILQVYIEAADADLDPTFQISKSFIKVIHNAQESSIAQQL